jgi:hypothetical protein
MRRRKPAHEKNRRMKKPAHEKTAAWKNRRKRNLPDFFQPIRTRARRQDSGRKRTASVDLQSI